MGASANRRLVSRVSVWSRLPSSTYTNSKHRPVWVMVPMSRRLVSSITLSSLKHGTTIEISGGAPIYGEFIEQGSSTVCYCNPDRGRLSATRDDQVRGL